MAAPFVIPSVYTAVDKTAPAYRSMASSVRSFASVAESSAMKVNRAFSKLQTGLDSTFNKLNIFRRLNATAGLLGISVGLAGVTSVIKKFVTAASSMEDARASFTALLGGAENAARMVADLNKLGASTPFEFKDLSDAARMMIGFGAATQNNVIDKLKMVGDIAQGNAEKLSGITLAFSQIQAGGKASMQDINQLINNGVPILAQLAKQWKMNAGAAREAVSKGRATSAEITKAFEAMTSSGGMFFNGMAIASQTFTGKMSTLADNVNIAFGQIGEAAMPIVKEYTDKLIVLAGKTADWATANQGIIKQKVSEWAERINNAISFLIENYEKIIFFAKLYIGTLVALKAISIATAVATYGMQAALFAYNVVLGISTALQGKSAFYVMGSKVAYVAYRAVVLGATAAQWLLNAAMTANPIGLIIVAIAGLIALIAVVITKWDSWGQVLAIFLGPLGMVISLIQSFRRNWDLIVQAFKEGGIVEGLKMIGKTILDAILAPLQKVLEIAAKLPGIGGMFGFAAKKIEAFREGMGVNMEGNNTPEAAPTPRLSTQAEQNRINTERTEKIERSTMDITVNDKTGNAKVKTSPNAPPVRLTPTVGAFGN